MKFFLLGIIALIVITAAPALGLAQNLQSLGGPANGLNVYIDPEHPGARMPVTVSLESFAADLDRASISWTLNGAAAAQGVGKKSFTFTTGAPGAVSRVTINVTTTGGEVWQKIITLYPASVDIVWEAQSYAPPFYRGKALYPYQGTVRVVAMPSIVSSGGTPFSASDLIYNWQVDRNPVPDASGFGKNVFVFHGGIPLKSNTISVLVSSLDQKYSAEGQITLAPVAPLVLFYADDPLLGTLFNAALQNPLTLQNQEINVTAVPYFSGNFNRDNLSYSWQMNNQDVATDKSTVTFRQTAGAGGSAQVSVQVSNPTAIFQGAGNNLTLSFGQQ